jgi:hypothetical protein
MRTFSDSYACRVVLAPPSSLHPVVRAGARPWRRFAASLFDRYRPELHYMRGPGPKWLEKHARNASY